MLVSGKVDSKAAADDILRMASVYSKDIVNSLIIVPLRQKQIMLKVQFAEVDRRKARTVRHQHSEHGRRKYSGHDFYRAVRAGFVGFSGDCSLV